MGIFSKLGDQIRGIMRRDKEALTRELAKGSTLSSGLYPGTGFDLLQAYGYDALSSYLRMEQDLISRYVEYEQIDEYPLTSTALDLYADDSTVTDAQSNRTMWVTAKDKNIETMLDDLLYRTLRIEDELWDKSRTLCKYGNEYEEILVTEHGVQGLHALAPPTVRRIEGPRGELYGFVQDFRGRFGYCIARGARIWGTDKVQEIQKFSGKTVLGYKDGVSKPFGVVKLHTNGTQKVFRVRTVHRELFLTEDHLVLAQIGKYEKPIWTKVKDLKIVRKSPRKRGGHGDISPEKSSRLIISTSMAPGEIPEWKSIWSEDPFLRKPGSGGPASPIVLPERPTAEFCKLFGFLLGDGWVTGDKRVTYARGVYPELNDYYDELLKGLGLDPRIRAVSGGDGEVTDVGSVQFARLLLSLGWVEGCSNKRVPGWIYGLPESHRDAFLRGFIDADGWTNNQPGRQPRHHFEIANYDLARDLKNLIDGLGYKSGNIGTRQRKPGTIVNGKTIKTQKRCYNVTFSDTKFDHPFVDDTLLEVSYYQDMEVYDLEVSDSAHNFISDGVVVHNSSQEFQQILASRMSMLNGIQGSSDPNFAAGNRRSVALEDWEVSHARLRGKHRRSIYGSSILEPARWIYKRLMLLEDAAMIYRLQRAPERYAFYIDVGDNPPAEALALVNRTRQQYRKQKYINPVTNQLDLRFDAISPQDDFFIPVRKGVEGSKIEVLGAPNWQSVEDITYFRDHLFAALKIPRAYLGQDKGIGKNVLAGEEVRYARTILRVQRELRMSMGKVCRVHLASQNIDPNAVSYDIRMTVPSAVFELAQAEVRNSRADLANRMKEFVSHHWVLSKVFQLSDDEIEGIMSEQDEDRKRDLEYQVQTTKAIGDTQMQTQIAGAAAMPQPPGAPPAAPAKPAQKLHQGMSPPYGRTSMTERELFRGDREGEKRAEEKLNRLLDNDQELAGHIKEVGNLLKELKAGNYRKK